MKTVFLWLRFPPSLAASVRERVGRKPSPTSVGREAVRAFGKAGYELDRQRGSHMVLRQAQSPCRRLTLPGPQGVEDGTAAGTHPAGWTVRGGNLPGCCEGGGVRRCALDCRAARRSARHHAICCVVARRRARQPPTVGSALQRRSSSAASCASRSSNVSSRTARPVHSRSRSAVHACMASSDRHRAKR
jgi:predicted RNA binding protein YcfA (HicA-like mRNA interferase family)